MNSFIETVAYNCDCTNEQAREYINDELRTLNELAEKNDLRYSDFEMACSNLGCDFDAIEIFINLMSTGVF